MSANIHEIAMSGRKISLTGRLDVVARSNSDNWRFAPVTRPLLLLHIQ